jgi:hypothetical protein
MVTLLTSYLLIQTELLSQYDSLYKKDTITRDSTEISNAIETRISLVQKDTSVCDSNINHKPQLKKTKKDIKGFFFSSFSLGGSRGKSYDMNSNFATFRINAGYADESFPIPLGLSAMYSKDIIEKSIYQTDVGLSLFLPIGEHFPFFALGLGGGLTFGNVRIVNDSIINQKTEKIERIDKLKGWYYLVSGEMLFVGIGDFALGLMCSYTKNSKRSMTSIMLVVHYARPFY